MEKQVDANNKDFFYQNHFHDYDHIVSKLIIGTEKMEFFPLVSVIMPVYNHPEYFKKSLQSVINQKCDFNYEIIVVDNGHPDFQLRNQRVVEEFKCAKIRYYVNTDNLGGNGSCNRGVNLANGKYITFCHDDDIFFDNTLDKLINVLKKNNLSTEAIFGGYDVIDEHDCIIADCGKRESIILKKKYGYKITISDLLYENYTNGCGALYNKDAFIQMGGYNPDYVPCADYALNIKYVSLYGGIALVDKTFLYRVSSQSDSSKVYIQISDINRVIKYNILNSGYVNRFFPRFIINSNLKATTYSLHSKWASNHLSFTRYLPYRIINLMWMLVLQVSRFYRSFRR